MSGSILLVDDEKDITTLLEEALRQEGFQSVRTASGGREAVDICRKMNADVIVLDVMLPDMDGFEVCRQIRQFSHSPILFLSSRSDEVDKILGLASGGDDYVAKPFSPREIAYRVKAQLRRVEYARSGAQPEKSRVIGLGPLSIDPDACLVFKNGAEIALTAREYGLLLYLAQNPNRIIGKERLYEHVWGEDAAGVDNTMMVHIRHLREKIEDDPSAPRLIVTVKGLGYKLVRENAS